MNTFPHIRTERLLLRQFRMSDAPEVQRLAGARAIAAGTFMPHPYVEGLAEQWIASLQTAYEKGGHVNFAITRAVDDTLIGSIGLTPDAAHRHAHLGYWVGVPYWNQGYCTEAARAVLCFGFTELNLHRIYALCFRSNPASGRILQKLGMRFEGCQREHYFHLGQFVDVDMYSMLNREYEAAFLNHPSTKRRLALRDQPYFPKWETDIAV